ncbi:MAG: PAS domain-containing protein, partial [Polyangiales bacterium]
MKPTAAGDAAAADLTQQRRVVELEGQIAAINKAQAVIELALDGTVLAANDNFLRALGYTQAEIVGKPHSMFVTPEYAASDAYRRFWDGLRSGNHDAGEYKRLGKGGREVWIQASYNPIFDANGKPFKVVKFATDVTERKLRNADFEGQIAAIGKAQAVIELGMDGTILWANDNFLRALGYTLDEIKGKHHRMFVAPEEARSPEYQRFWQNLREGKHDAGEYKRIGKGGREVWIQASYNPILDLSGKPFKVVKYATVVTDEKLIYLQLAAAIDALSRGDLTARMSGDFKGEKAELRDKMNTTVASLAKLVKQIDEAVSAINAASNDIAEGNSSLNDRTQEQATSLQSTAASLERLTATVKQNASHGNQANQLAAAARNTAQKGGQVVSSAVSAMSAITDSSKKVA